MTWKYGKYDMLVQTAEGEMKANMTNLRRNMKDTKFRKVDDMMKRGKYVMPHASSEWGNHDA